MALIHSPTLPKNGLVFCLDAANSKSHSGANWYDLTKNFTLNYDYNNGRISHVDSGKSSYFYRDIVATHADHYGSVETINLSSGFTFIATVYLEGITTSANGILTNHNHSANAGGGLTARYISDTDYRISCNTGTGTGRTYHTYYGTTNIKDTWAHLVQRYDNAESLNSLWVNATKEHEVSYSMATADLPIDVFGWSTNYMATAYRIQGRIGACMVYSRSLSDEEIYESYRILGTRYGI